VSPPPLPTPSQASMQTSTGSQLLVQPRPVCSTQPYTATITYMYGGTEIRKYRLQVNLVPTSTAEIKISKIFRVKSRLPSSGNDVSGYKSLSIPSWTPPSWKRWSLHLKLIYQTSRRHSQGLTNFKLHTNPKGVTTDWLDTQK
jgi:hypothetical protein